MGPWTEVEEPLDTEASQFHSVVVGPDGSVFAGGWSYDVDMPIPDAHPFLAAFTP